MSRSRGGAVGKCKAIIERPRLSARSASDRAGRGKKKRTKTGTSERSPSCCFYRLILKDQYFSCQKEFWLRREEKSSVSLSAAEGFPFQDFSLIRSKPKLFPQPWPSVGCENQLVTEGDLAVRDGDSDSEQIHNRPGDGHRTEPTAWSDINNPANKFNLGDNHFSNQFCGAIRNYPA